jgi:acyl-CoA thioester hydrolase
MTDMPAYTARIPVRWGDMDALGHVNNAVYFTYFEQARIDYIQGMTDVLRTRNATTGPVLVAVDATFKKPVLHPATVIVHVFVGEVGRTSFSLLSRLSVEGDEDTLYAESRATLVWIDRSTGRPTPLPDALRHRLSG